MNPPAQTVPSMNEATGKPAFSMQAYRPGPGEPAWDEIIAPLPGAHALQTWEWAQVKQAYGWDPLPYLWRDAAGNVAAAALVLRRRLAAGGLRLPASVLYVPRGPLLDWQDGALRGQVLGDLESLARRSGVIFLKIDPDIVLGYGFEMPDEGEPPAQSTQLPHFPALEARGWRFSPEQIQFRNTVWLDLSVDEAAWLARMKPKTRYNLRLAQRKGVTVREATLADLDLLYRLYAETSVRDGFVIRPRDYYLSVWRTFMESNLALGLIAELDGEPLAALVLFHFGRKAWYLYGMSSDTQRQAMPNYPLQWEAMRHAKALGCELYDLWGAPDSPDPHDPLAGVYRFKEGWGGQLVRTPGAWDFVARPALYGLGMNVLPRVLAFTRRRRVSQVQREVSP